jgi:uncharacterized protein involved in response to NO
VSLRLVAPKEVSKRSVPAPYQLLFPLGVAYAIVAALVWPLHALGWIAYPAPLHWTLMVQGFLHCFILGFLLTALPSFLHADRVRPWEIAVVAAAMAAFGALAVGGALVAAQAAYLVTFAALAAIVIRRFPRRRGDPPEEFLLVALGLAFGFAGGGLRLAVEAGWIADPTPRFALHLIARGMVLALVLGIGGLLVPTFSAMREPLVIPGIARPGQRAPRRALYLPIAVAFVAAAVCDGIGRPTAASWLRAIAGSVLGLLVWKLFRRPGRRDLLSYSIWGSGWFILAGLWLGALLPAKTVLVFHLIYLGGFGMLTMGIATRVVVSHGGYPSAQERRVLRPTSIGALFLSVAARAAGEFAPVHGTAFYAAGGLLWIAAWAIWSARAFPCILKPFSAVSPRTTFG